VILNRVRSPQFPNTICEVVYQGQMEKDCQFVFACDGRSLTPKEDDEWALVQAIARKITAGELWLPELGYSTSVKDALAIGVPPEREEDAHIAVRPPQSPPGPEPSNGEMVVATGTGFIINDRGDLVTDNHVVDDVHGLVLG
jgi:S1-C subfamily serine protease